MAIAVMTDSGADLTAEEIETFSIAWLPVEIITPSGCHIKDTADIDIVSFYHLMEKEQGKFVSVQIKTDDIVSEAESLLRHNDYVVYITMSSKMSGTYLNALAAQRLIGERLIVFDSRSISTGQATLVLKAVSDIASGIVDAQHMEDYLTTLRGKLHFYFVLESLQYLKNGGRIGKASYLVGHMLKLKPALSIDESGEIYAVEKLRGGGKRIIKFFSTLLKQYPPSTELFPLQLVYGIPTQWDISFEQWLADQGYPYVIRKTRPTTTIHGGPYSLGLAWYV